MDNAIQKLPLPSTSIWDTQSMGKNLKSESGAGLFLKFIFFSTINACHFSEKIWQLDWKELSIKTSEQFFLQIRG